MVRVKIRIGIGLGLGLRLTLMFIVGAIVTGANVVHSCGHVNPPESPRHFC